MDLVIFDLDGTLVDSRRAIAATFNAALGSRGHAPVPDSTVIDMIGLTLWHMFPRVLPGLADAENDALVEAYRARYVPLAEEHERVYDGIAALLSDLDRAGRALAVATSKSTEGARRVLRFHGLDHHFRLLLGQDAVPTPKPAPDMALHVLRELGRDAASAVVVGDTEYDMVMGRAAGTHTIGVTWGSHDRGRLAPHADRVVDSVAELRELLAP